MSVEEKVLAKLLSQEWTSSSEIEALFPAGEQGHFSWPQRLRGLRNRGYKIIRRTVVGTKKLSEWKIEKPEQEPVYREVHGQLEMAI
jgi:hypothetical protein